jgi:hypothetical protein
LPWEGALVADSAVLGRFHSVDQDAGVVPGQGVGGGALPVRQRGGERERPRLAGGPFVGGLQPAAGLGDEGGDGVGEATA